MAAEAGAEPHDTPPTEPSTLGLHAVLFNTLLLTVVLGVCAAWRRRGAPATRLLWGARGRCGAAVNTTCIDSGIPLLWKLVLGICVAPWLRVAWQLGYMGIAAAAGAEPHDTPPAEPTTLRLHAVLFDTLLLMVVSGVCAAWRRRGAPATRLLGGGRGRQGAAASRWCIGLSSRPRQCPGPTLCVTLWLRAAGQRG
eukprot:gene8580-19412_t